MKIVVNLNRVKAAHSKIDGYKFNFVLYNVTIFCFEGETDIDFWGISHQKGSTGVDVIYLGDDIGMQSSVMMSEELYKRFLLPRLASVISAARAINPDIIVFYHSCGYVTPFIPLLIEAGIDVLNPVQPECMDFEEIHAEFGDKLSFFGTLGTQTTFPFGTMQDVKDAVKHNLDIAGEKGGLIVAPTHLLEPEVPWANVKAYVEACENYKKI